MKSVIQIKETCLYVSDLNQTYSFYHELLELPLISLVKGRHIFFRAGSSVLLCFLPDVTKNESELPPHFASGKQHLAFEVAEENYERTLEEIRSKNIEITHEHTWPHGLKSFYFDDPDRHVLEVVTSRLWL